MSSTRRETELRKDPYPDSDSLGILPAKSIVTFTGEEKGKYVQVEVELEEGSVLGWIESKSLARKETKEDEEADEREKNVINVRKSKRKRRSIPVPGDEGILLGRTPTFSYGFFGGGQLDLLAVEGAQDSLLGYGFTGGATLSFVLDPTFRIRTEVDYAVHSAMNSSSKLLSFGFVDLSATGEIPLGSQFYVLGGLQYSLGIGLDNSDNVASPTILTAAGDVSGLWGLAGLGYKFSIGESSSLSIRARYAGAFMSSPVGFHTVGLQAVWEIEG
ncbi:MAG: hypothetical protein ACKN9V_08575 [Pseudomonadota bacterium]